MPDPDASVEILEHGSGSDVFFDDSFFDNEQFLTGVLDTQAQIDWEVDFYGGQTSHTNTDCQDISSSYNLYGAVDFGAWEASTSASFDFSAYNVDATAKDEIEWTEFLSEPLDGVNHHVPQEALLWQANSHVDDTTANGESDSSLTPPEVNLDAVNSPDTSGVIAGSKDITDAGTWHSAADWEIQRTAITQLYAIEGKSLRDVMTIMAQRHGHRGTVKMYKTRIKKWNLDKKNKPDDMAFILRMKALRMKQGMRTIFKIRGRLLHDEDITKYEKRKLRQNPAFLSDHWDIQKPAHIDYYSPCSCPDSKRINTMTMQGEPKCSECMKSHVLEKLQQDHSSLALQSLLAAHAPTDHTDPRPTTEQASSARLAASLISEYIRFSMKLPAWTTPNENWLSIPRLTSEPDLLRMPFSALIAPVCRLSDHTNIDEAVQLVCRALAFLPHMTTVQHPILLQEVLCAALALLRNGLRQVAHMVLDFVHNTSVKQLGSGHPWSQVSQHLGETTDGLDHCLAEMYCCASLGFIKHFGSQNILAVRYKAGYVHDVLGIESSGSAITTLSALGKDCEKALDNECEPLGSPALDSFFVVTRHLANLLLDQGQLRHALALGQGWLQHAESTNNYWETIRALELVSDVQIKASKSTACYAERNLRQALKITEDKIGKDDPCFLHLTCKLAKWYVMWGQREEAELMRAKTKEFFVFLLKQTDLLHQNNESRQQVPTLDEPVMTQAKLHPRTTKCTLERKMVKVPRAPAYHSR